MKKLAICIPTFNRSKLLNRLLKSIPSNSDIMISICDDGSNDDTSEIVKKHRSRLDISYIYQKNKGRASALRNAILNSKGEFDMIVDSDDYFEKNGVEIILSTINKKRDINFFVFPIKILKNSKSKIISLSGIKKINYITLKSEFKYNYDLQEVVQHSLILKVMYDEPDKIRRIPTGFLWFRISEISDCLPIDTFPVKVKEYLSDGMTNNLLPLKIDYPQYLVAMYEAALKSKKIKSYLSQFKYIILFYRYSFHNKSLKLLKFQDFPLFIIGYFYGLLDLLIILLFHKRK